MSEKLSVLLLDDEPIVGRRLGPALAKIGCDVEAFEDPKKALDRIDQKVFDVVVTDIRMGEIDGMQVLDRVRAASPRTRVILITGYAMMELAREAMERGAFDFISKPFKAKDLREVVVRAARALGVPVVLEPEAIGS